MQSLGYWMFLYYYAVTAVLVAHVHQVSVVYGAVTNQEGGIDDEYSGTNGLLGDGKHCICHGESSAYKRVVGPTFCLSFYGIYKPVKYGRFAVILLWSSSNGSFSVMSYSEADQFIIIPNPVMQKVQQGWEIKPEIEYCSITLYGVKSLCKEMIHTMSQAMCDYRSLEQFSESTSVKVCYVAAVLLWHQKIMCQLKLKYLHCLHKIAATNAQLQVSQRSLLKLNQAKNGSIQWMNNKFIQLVSSEEVLIEGLFANPCYLITLANSTLALCQQENDTWNDHFVYHNLLDIFIVVLNHSFSASTITRRSYKRIINDMLLYNQLMEVTTFTKTLPTCSFYQHRIATRMMEIKSITKVLSESAKLLKLFIPAKISNRLNHQYSPWSVMVGNTTYENKLLLVVPSHTYYWLRKYHHLKVACWHLSNDSMFVISEPLCNYMFWETNIYAETTKFILYLGNESITGPLNKKLQSTGSVTNKIFILNLKYMHSLPNECRNIIHANAWLSGCFKNETCNCHLELGRNTQCTPLHYASQNGHGQVVTILLCSKAEVDARNDALAGVPLTSFVDLLDWHQLVFYLITVKSCALNITESYSESSYNSSSYWECDLVYYEQWKDCSFTTSSTLNFNRKNDSGISNHEDDVFHSSFFFTDHIAPIFTIFFCNPHGMDLLFRLIIILIIFFSLYCWIFHYICGSNVTLLIEPIFSDACLFSKVEESLETNYYKSFSLYLKDRYIELVSHSCVKADLISDVSNIAVEAARLTIDQLPDAVPSHCYCYDTDFKGKTCKEETKQNVSVQAFSDQCAVPVNMTHMIVSTDLSNKFNLSLKASTAVIHEDMHCENQNSNCLSNSAENQHLVVERGNKVDTSEARAKEAATTAKCVSQDKQYTCYAVILNIFPYIFISAVICFQVCNFHLNIASSIIETKLLYNSSALDYKWIEFCEIQCYSEQDIFDCSQQLISASETDFNYLIIQSFWQCFTVEVDMFYSLLDEMLVFMLILYSKLLSLLTSLYPQINTIFCALHAISFEVIQIALNESYQTNIDTDDITAESCSFDCANPHTHNMCYPVYLVRSINRTKAERDLNSNLQAFNHSAVEQSNLLGASNLTLSVERPTDLPPATVQTVSTASRTQSGASSLVNITSYSTSRLPEATVSQDLDYQTDFGKDKPVSTEERRKNVRVVPKEADVDTILQSTYQKRRDKVAAATVGSNVPPPIHSYVKSTDAVPSFNASVDKSRKSLPRRACLVYHNERYDLDPNLLSQPEATKYLVKVRTEINPGRYMARLELHSSSKDDRLPNLDATEKAATTSNNEPAALPVRERKHFPSNTNRAGYIMFSSDLGCFSGSIQYPLPTKKAVASRIGYGGNAVVFVVFYSGKEFAVKKTVYRSKEISVHSQLCHPNIINLEAVLVGEKHERHRDKHYVYCFMQKMDINFRNVLSTKDYGCLKHLKVQLNEKREQWELVLVNAKHVLRSVLKALEYMHSQGLVHRDVKASNILIKMTCHCTEVLYCNCHQGKFLVQIGDFDSSATVPGYQLQLEEHQMIRYASVLPLGTMGYRAPEVSMHLVLSGPYETLYTTSVDIWSFGCLLLTVFIGKSGPLKQRGEASLLLSAQDHPYSQELYNKIIKIDEVQKHYRNTHGVCDLVQKCLQVQPHCRPTAKELLELDFFKF